MPDWINPGCSPSPRMAQKLSFLVQKIYSRAKLTSRIAYQLLCMGKQLDLLQEG